MESAMMLSPEHKPAETRGGCGNEESSIRSFVAILAIASAVACAPGLLAAANPQFSDSSLKGPYVFRCSGHALFTTPELNGATGQFIGSVGTINFDGGGGASGMVTTSGTETATGAARPSGLHYYGQVVCDSKIKGTYTVRPDGIGLLELNFSGASNSTCGDSSGTFAMILASPSTIEFVSTGQTTADPTRGAFNAYVVEGEMKRQIEK
jgi:hypothetical protein